MIICKDCINYKLHREKCWFYWESKKQCSQFRKDIEQEPEFIEE